jgi:hypothetical protein
MKYLSGWNACIMQRKQQLRLDACQSGRSQPTRRWRCGDEAGPQLDASGMDLLYAQHASAAASIIESMSTFRHSRIITRIVLAWFVLALGTAAASSLVQPQARQLVCSAAGPLRFVAVDDVGSTPGATGLQDCPMCILAGAPPPWMPAAVLVRLPAVAPLASGGMPVLAAARAAPPLPARGPPAIA